jgi:hypothetical protein
MDISSLINFVLYKAFRRGVWVETIVLTITLSPYFLVDELDVFSYRHHFLTDQLG